MYGPAGKFASEAFETNERVTAETLSYMEAVKIEPQELMEFLEFCAEKIHQEQDSRKSTERTRRMQL
jgi:hypothetical protein